MQIGARTDFHASLLNGHVVVLQHIGIRPCLIRGVSHLTFAVLEAGNDDARLLCSFGFFPLFQFDDNQLIAPLGVQARYDEVYTLGRQRNLILDGHTDFIRQFRHVDHFVHELHRVSPRTHLVGRRMPPQVLHESTVDVVGYRIVEHILNKLSFGGLIDNHSSSYFFTLP